MLESITRHIRIVEPSSQWDEWLAGCHGATVFHQFAWTEVMRICFKTDAQLLRIPLGSGHHALLTLSIRPCGRGWLPLAIAGDTGAYGGLVATRPLHPHESRLILDWVLTYHSAVIINGNPFSGDLPVPPGCKPRPDDTHCLELAPLNQLRLNFSRGCRARGNKARRHDLQLEIRQGAGAVDLFYPLYEDSVARWGDRLTWLRPRHFFEQVMQVFRNQAIIMVAVHHGLPVSALLLLCGHGTCHYLAGATREGAQGLCPSNFLIEEALDWAHQNGMDRFDFGASQGLAGVQQFKASFGATLMPMLGFSRLPWAHQSYLRVHHYLSARKPQATPGILAESRS